MLGQEALIDKFYKLIDEDKLPHFVILLGQKGSGKKTVAKLIADKLEAKICTPDDKFDVEYARYIQENAYKQKEKVVYLMSDADSSSIAAKNAILKITEEPPENAYFIMTLISKHSIPGTIGSRGKVFKMNTYPKFILARICKEEYGIEVNDRALEIYETPGEIIEVYGIGQSFEDMENFVSKVVDNIGEVSDANAFKIAEKISFKDGDDGFNLTSFWITFNNQCLKKSREIHNSKSYMYLSFIRETDGYQQKLSVKGINKRSLFDMWVLEIRDTYCKYN